MDVFGFVQAKLRKALQKVSAKYAIGVFCTKLASKAVPHPRIFVTDHDVFPPCGCVCGKIAVSLPAHAICRSCLGEGASDHKIQTHKHF